MTVAAGRNQPGTGGTPLHRKLGIREGGPALLVDAPEGFAAASLAEVETDSLPGPTSYDVILLFATQAADLPARFAAQLPRLTTAGGLWVCWPKRTARGADRIESELDGDAVRAIGLATGLVDNKVCAVNATWSGLRFVRRKANRQPK